VDIVHVNLANVLWVAFLIPSGSLSLVKYSVYFNSSYTTYNVYVCIAYDANRNIVFPLNFSEKA
jgi:hypothetical protein